MQTTDGRISVLYVDDDPGFAEVAATFVEGLDDRIDVETVTNVDAALSRLFGADVAVDCVVSDYDMPGRNGIELLEAVREAFPDLPFILYTGKGSEAVAGDAISAGVTDYLQKGTGTDQYEILTHRLVNAVTASRSAAEAERRRHWLEQLLKTVPGCVVQLDADGRFVYANRRAKEVLGLEQSAVTERAYNDPEWRIKDLDGESIPDAELPFRQVRDSGEPLYGFRHTIEWPDGTRKVLVVNGAPLFDADGDVERVVFSLVDVTEPTERERSLRETERRLQLVLAVTETGVWEWDVETDDVWWSETLERVMGLEPGAFEGTLEAVIERIHRDDRADVRARVARAVERDETYEAEFRMFHADGDVRWIAVRGQLVEDDGRRMVGVHQDITEQRQLRADLRTTTDQYRTVVENLPYGGVFLYDETLECVLAGGQGLADVGLTPGDVEGDRPSERYPTPIADEIESNLRAAFDGRDGVFEQAYQDRVYQVWTLPIEDLDGRIDRVMAVSREVTEHRRRERELKGQTDRLAEFAGVVSHDLRNPLRVAEGRLTLAREACDSDHLDAVEAALDRMYDIIDDVLWLAREGDDIGETEPLDLRAQVEAAWAFTVDSRDDAVLVVDVDDTDGLGTVDADGNRLGQLLENLFRNCVEHGSTSSQPKADDAVEHGSTRSRPQGGDSTRRDRSGSRAQSGDSVRRDDTDTVTVTVGPLTDGFYVADDGPGIPESERENVFKSGYSTTASGSGFGLRIAKQIADAHSWSLSVTESDGGGARFELRGIDS